MGFADYVLPHRLLLNRELRKEADKLREVVSAYQEEYGYKIAQVNEEIETAIAEANREIEKVKESLVAKLTADQELLNAVQNNLFEYVDAFFQQKLTKHILELLRLEREYISDNISFLTDQMTLIGEEIQILEDRKTRLTSQTDIKDFVELLNLSGCDLTIDVDETAKTLLNKVYIAANESEKGSAKRRTLFKLAETLQERTELLPLITYISWIIQLKIQFSKELSQQRTQLRSEYRSKQSEIDDAQKTVDQLGREMTDIARRVREYWAVPIAELGVELTSYYYEKKQLPKYSERNAELREYCEEHKEISQQLKSMAESHSDDSYRWDRLQRERKDLSEKIEDAQRDLKRIKSVESSIDSTKEKRNTWFEKKKSILEICSQSGVYLLRDKDSGESDEVRIISERLDDYLQQQAQIETENREALERIQSEKYDIVSKLEAEISIANANLEKAQNDYSRAKTSLSKLQESDRRFFLAKLFRESEEVSTAKKKLVDEKRCLEAARDYLASLISEKESQEKAYDKKIKDFRGIRNGQLKISIKSYKRRLEELLSRRNSAGTSEEDKDETQI